MKPYEERGMDSPSWLDELRAQLAQRNLPPVYIERLVAELSDHLSDLLEEQKGMEANTSGAAIGRIGDPDQVAQAASVAYGRRTFYGRHPVLTFLVLPVLALPLLWFPLLLACEWRGEDLSRVSAAATSLTGLASLRIAWFAVWQLPVVIAAILWCRLATSCGRPWPWRMLSCAILALLTIFVVPLVLPPREGQPARFALDRTIPFVTPLRGIAAAQCAIPLAIGRASCRERVYISEVV